MRDQQDRAVTCRRQDVPHERLGCFRVEMRSRLVEQEHRSVGQESPGDRQALALAAGELRALLADQRLEPVGERGDPVADAGAMEGVLELRVGRARAGEAEVRPDRRVEHVGVLAGEGEGAPQVVLTELAHVATRESHTAFLGVEEAEQEVRHGRLADAARPDERDLPARLEQQVEPAERRWPAGLVAGGHSLERHGRGQRRRQAEARRDRARPARGRRARTRAGPPRSWPRAPGGGLKRCDALERRQGEQREGRHEHPVERRVGRPPRARRRPSGPRSGSRGPPRGRPSSASRRASRASSSLRARMRSIVSASRP